MVRSGFVVYGLKYAMEGDRMSLTKQWRALAALVINNLPEPEELSKTIVQYFVENPGKLAAQLKLATTTRGLRLLTDAEREKLRLTRDGPLVATMIEESFDPNGFVLTVDYGESVESLVKKGEYDYANPDISTEHFPTKRTGKVSLAGLRLVHFGRDMSTESIERELGAMGLRPAETHEVLAFGVKFPDVQRMYPVVALGSVWQGPYGYRSAPYLWGGGGGRDLDLDLFEDDWREHYRFLAVRES